MTFTTNTKQQKEQRVHEMAQYLMQRNIMYVLHRDSVVIPVHDSDGDLHNEICYDMEDVGCVVGE